jgi:NTE family protein
MRRVDATRVREVLSSAPLIHGLPARRLQRLLAASHLESYTPGQVIVREGTFGDAFYVVIQGAVVVQVSHGAGDATHLATLGPGDYFGEMALLSGRPRVADVLASEQTEVLAVPASVFAAQLLGDPRFKARLAAESQERETDLVRQRVARTLQSVPVFGTLRWEELLRLAASGQVETFPRGAIVCRQGELGTALYVVLTGEVNVRAITPAGERTLTTLGSGASFGEMALLTGAPIPATLEAAVESTLLTLDKANFNTLLDQAPFARNISQMLGERLREQDAAASDLAGANGAVVTVASTEPDLGKTTLAVNLAASLAQHVGSVVLVDLDPERAASRYLGLSDAELGAARGEPDLARLPHAAEDLAVLPLTLGQGNAGVARLTRTLDALKRGYRFVVLDTTARAGGSLAAIGRLSDSVLYLTRGVVAPPELPGRAELLLVYVPEALSTGPAPVVGGRVFRLPSNPETMERFNRRGRPFVLAEPRGFLSRAIGRIARYLTRQQVGLVLAGGAAWGPSEVGVLAGLEERGADIDLVAATGIGGLLGAAYASGLPVQALERLALAFHSPWEELLAPRHPLPADHGQNKRLRHLLRTIFGNTELGSLQVPLWLSAADADTGEEVVLREGRVVDALEATIGLPGLLPSRRQQGRALVDGSVITPLPLRLAREMGADVLVAVSGGPQPQLNALARRRRGGGRRQAPLRLALLTLRLSSYNLAATSAEMADLVITPSLGGLPNAGRGRPLIEQGRVAAAAAAPRIAELQAIRLRPPRTE